MSKYIDVDALIDKLKSCSYLTWSKDVNRAWWAQAVQVKDNIVKCIERQSTADVVEVVRCKDCKYSEIDENGNLWCAFYNGKIREMPNGYCWHGERREG